MQSSRAPVKDVLVSKPKLFAVVSLIVISVLAVPVILPHIRHTSMIYHILMHIASVIIAVFLGVSAILVVISVIALTLATAASFNHYYSALAASKTKTKKTGGGSGSGAASSSSAASAATSTTNPKALSKKELNSFISCINTANKSQGVTHKVATNCLDTAKGITPSSIGGAAAGGSTTPSAVAAAGAG